MACGLPIPVPRYLLRFAALALFLVPIARLALGTGVLARGARRFSSASLVLNEVSSQATLQQLSDVHLSPCSFHSRIWLTALPAADKCTPTRVGKFASLLSLNGLSLKRVDPCVLSAFGHY